MVTQRQAMRLASYLSENGIADRVFAELIGVTRQAVHRYKTGERFPEQPVLARIFKQTKGEVTANDFVFPVKAVKRRPEVRAA